MIIDSSALLAILFDEPDGRAFARAIHAASVRLMSTMSMLEASMLMLSRRGQAGLARLARTRRVRPLRQGPPSGRAQFRRLRRLCARRDGGRAAVVQGHGFRRDRCGGGGDGGRLGSFQDLPAYLTTRIPANFYRHDPAAIHQEM